MSSCIIKLVCLSGKHRVHTYLNSTLGELNFGATFERLIERVLPPPTPTFERLIERLTHIHI